MPDYPVDTNILAYNKEANLESPVGSGEAIDISVADHATTYATRALWVGTAGNVKVDMLGATGVTFLNVQDGTLLPIRVSKVYQSGTTAANMVAVW